MRTGIRILPNHCISTDVWYPLEIFLSDWLSDMCDDEFAIVKELTTVGDAVDYSILFEHPEDAAFVKLKDLPADLSRYIHLK